MARTLDDRNLGRLPNGCGSGAAAGSTGGDLSWPLERAARLHGGRTALIDGERRVTYNGLQARVGGLGSALDELGVPARARVHGVGPEAAFLAGLPAASPASRPVPTAAHR